MSLPERFEEYLKRGIIRKYSIDKSRAEFLINESESSLEGLKERVEKIGINEKNANSIIKDCYDIIMELIRAKLLLDGYKSSGQYSHEAEISYLRELGFSDNEILFLNDLRYFRNSVTYYGKILNKEYALKVYNYLINIFPKLMKKIKSNNKILESAEFVINRAKHVKINKIKIEEFCKKFDHKNNENIKHWLDEAPFDINLLNKEDKLNFLLVFNSISFSYWGEPKWTIEYKDKKFDGSWGMIASLARGIEENNLILRSDFLENIREKEFADILRGNIEIPLFKERLRILNELGKILIEKYNGDFRNVVRKANGDAINLLNILIKDFPFFDDNAIYEGKKILFYKRAQLFVADIYQGFKGKNYGELKNTDKLTACADYKLPQVLRRLGIISYSKELESKIDNKIELKKGSREEIEIRASTIWAVKFIELELEKKVKNIDSLHVNDHLWLLSQKKSPNDKPYLRVRTTSY